jgi:hypothetical protein
LEQEVEARVLAHTGERSKGQIQVLGKRKKGDAAYLEGVYSKRSIVVFKVKKITS